MTYRLIIPIYTNEHLADNCISGIDVDWRHLIIVDNSKESFCKKYEGRGATIYYYPENIGVARAWNMGLKADCDWTFFIGIGAVFPNGFSEVLAELKNASDYALITDLAFHCNAISRKTVGAVGYFDENFYPAYYEDTDYVRRMQLAGIEIKATQIAGYSALQANSTESDQGLPVHYLNLEKYYIEKWGGKPGEEKFDKPFGDKGIGHWVGQSIKTLKQKYGV
jgi:GT2 family glycosyltransferase